MNKEKFLKYAYKVHSITNIILLSIAPAIAIKGYGNEAIALIAVYLLGTVLVTKES